ncbi:MAG: hypothetical protein CL912_01325 [Deltaproteobacteria bacterium]|nr:hypothetical protein [Deltaproteobacteria bacterium]
MMNAGYLRSFSRLSYPQQQYSYLSETFAIPTENAESRTHSSPRDFLEHQPFLGSPDPCTNGKWSADMRRTSPTTPPTSFDV